MSLILALIVILLMTMGIAVIISSMRSGFLFGSFFKKKLIAQEIAESGVNRALAWIKLAAQGDSNAKSIASQITTIEANTWPVIQNAISSNVLSFNGNEYTGCTTNTLPCKVPNFTGLCSGSYCSEEVLIYSAVPGASLANGPVNFNLISSVRNKDTGEKYTIETIVSLGFMSFAKISFGILNPAGSGPFNFDNSNYDGQVHFGKFATKPIFRYGNQNFAGPVTFEYSGSDLPFEASGLGAINMPVGYLSNYNLSDDVATPLEVMNHVQDEASSSVVSWKNKELCLFLKDNTVERYDCNSSDPFANQTNMYQSYVDSVPIPDQGLVIYSSKDIHVKGIYNKSLTIASEQSIVIEGDVVRRRQKGANYSLGLVAQEDIIVPPYIPNPGGYLAQQSEFANNNASTSVGQIWPATNQNMDVNGTADLDPASGGLFNGLTNFPSFYDFPSTAHYTPPPPWVAAPSNDQDLDDPDYLFPGGSAYWAWGTSFCNNSPVSRGCANMPSILDIDAAMFSVSGKFNVENLNDPSTGYTMLARDPANPAKIKKYSLDPSSPDYYYTIDAATGNINGRKAEPLYCMNQKTPLAADPSNTCGLGYEAVRPPATGLWINGGLLTKDFGVARLKDCGGVAGQICGFDRKHIKYDKTLDTYLPPAFPRTRKVELKVIATKSYVSR